VAEDFTLSALAEIAGMPKRAVQLWADAGVIKANPATMLAGSGVHRRFKREELIIACIIAPFAKQKMAIGALENISIVVRVMLRDNEYPEFQMAAEGRNNNYMVVYWYERKNGDLAIDLFRPLSDSKPNQNFFDVLKAGTEDHRRRAVKVDVIPLNEVLRNLPAKP
jgi:hypothetical protein